MLITNEKIDVTLDMMNNANMTRMTPQGLQLGVPVDKGGLSWKTLASGELQDSDFDKIEDYFIQKLSK